MNPPVPAFHSQTSPLFAGLDANATAAKPSSVIGTLAADDERTDL
jgi:hypothetical protein